MSITIRESTNKDTDIIYEMYVELYKHLNNTGFVLNLNKESVVKEIISESVNSKYSKIYLAVKDNEPIGFIKLVVTRINSMFKSPNGKFIGNITDLFVLPNFRGENVGKKLLVSGVDYLKTFKTAIIQVNTSSGNTRTMEFYKKNDFEVDFTSFKYTQGKDFL